MPTCLFTDDTGMSKHRLPPYNAYYYNWQTLNFTASDSSSDNRCFSKVLIVLQLMQLAGSKIQLSITLFENTYFLTFSLNHFLNSFWLCPLLSPSSSWKNNSGLISYFLLTILKVSIRSLLLWPRLPISATAELLLQNYILFETVFQDVLVISINNW